MISATTIIPLKVLIPLLSSPICAAFNLPRLAWFIATIATWSSFAAVLFLTMHMLDHGEAISYAMGGWLAPIGIEYRLDWLNLLLILLISGVASLLMPFAYHLVKQEIDQHKQALFYTIYLLCYAGLLGISITNDAFNIYVFLEISSLATYSLIAMGKERKALTAAFEYLILGSIGATFYLIGIGLLYMATGTLNITDLSLHISESPYETPIMVGFAFVVIGLLMKVALFPMHSWLCRSYSYSPSFVATLLSATATKVSLYVLIRIAYGVFGQEYSFNDDFTIEDFMQTVLYPLALISILAGSFTAMYQKDIRKSLAYSSVAQIGYMVLGISIMQSEGLSAAIVHMLNHGLAKAGLFAVCGAVTLRFCGTTIEHFKGMGKYMPFTMAGFILCGLSMIGVPMTAGFISKWTLLQAALTYQLWLAVIIILISSLMAIIYIWRIIEAAYFCEHPNVVIHEKKEAPLPVLFTIWSFALLSIYFGLDTSYSLDFAVNAATSLTTGEAM